MNNEQNNSSRKGKLKERIKTITIIILIIIIIILLLKGCNGESNIGNNGSDNVDNTIQIIEDDDTTLQDTTNGKIRIKINPVITIRNGMMEDLNFCNYNDNRIFKLRIVVNDQCIYESGEIKAGEILKSAYLDAGNLKKGENKGIAQVLSYSNSKELMSQTNVEISLDYIN